MSLSQPSVSNVLQGDDATSCTSTRCRAASASRPSTRPNGMDVSVTRVVRNAGGRVIHSDTWRTHYVLWNGVIQVGR